MFTRFARFVVFAVSVTALAAPLHAATNTLSVTLNLAGLPSSLTVCRDPTAIQAFGVDDIWQIPIDVDNNASTGDYGIDVLLQVQTPQQTYPCSPSVISTASALSAEVAVWNSAQNQFVSSNLSATVTPDFATNSLTISVDLSGPLANLTPKSPIYAGTAGFYTPTGMSPTYAYDTMPSLTIGATATDPAGDVQQCSSPCSPSVSWYPLIDLVGASANTTSPLPGGTSSNPPPPPFGANTIDFEIDLASLPTTVNLCNSSTESSYYDFMWTVGANYDATFAAPLTLFAAHTPLESGCSSPTSAALLTSVSGALYKLDPNNIQNGYTLVESLPATVDTTNGKIVIQADRTDPNLTGFASGQLIESTFENMIVSNGAQEISPSAFSTAYPSDPSTPLFDFGSSVVDPNGDVCTSSSLSSCTSTAYPLIDIIGGSAHMDDYIFRNSFE